MLYFESSDVWCIYLFSNNEWFIVFIVCILQAEIFLPKEYDNRNESENAINVCIHLEKFRDIII